MGEKEIISVPFVVLESERARHERERKDERTKWFILTLVLVLLLFGTNAAWIAYESSWETVETVTQEVTQEAENGINRFIGGDYYGYTTNPNNTDENPPA